MEESDGEESGEAVEGELERDEWRASPCGSSLVLPPKEGAKEGAFSLTRESYERLYDYQRDGVAWMARLWQLHHGGVLADEMGLGKTVQVCSLLNGARKAGATHALLVMPMGLIDQWAKEAKKWCPGWPIHVCHGTAAQQAKAVRRIRRPEGGLFITSYGKVSGLQDIMQLTIDDCPSPKSKKGRAALEWGARRPKQGEAKRRRLDDDDAEFDEEEEAPREVDVPKTGYAAVGTVKQWDIMVCDEAHKMKSISGLLSRSVRQFRSNCRVLLTGTPVQNALQDLWALMDFAQPGLLGNHATFNKRFSDPIDRGSVRGAKPTAVELKNILAEQLRDLISPHLLRRTKMGTGLVLDAGAAEAEAGTTATEAEGEEEGAGAVAKRLPPKKETIVWLKPTEEQTELYRKILEDSEVIREARQKGKLGIEVFRAIGLLKRLCNHPMMIVPCGRHGAGSWKELMAKAVETALAKASAPEEPEDKDDEDAAELPSLDHGDDESMAVGEGVGSVKDDAQGGGSVEAMLEGLARDHASMMQQSAKLRCLASLLPKLAQKGHRTLIFSGSTKMLDLIQICCLKPNGLRCLLIDGQTDAQARAEKVAKFQRDRDRFQCMLLTTSCGGVGLNLTSADRVIIVDPDWNPATDAQAVDRAFRIGQEKEVRVYRLVVSGFIEDRMFRLQVFKMGLTKTVLEAESRQSYFTAKEIKALFEWSDPMEGVTRKLLQEKHGEDVEEVVYRLAEEDGAADGWLEAGPVVGLNDFGALYGAIAHVEEEPMDSASAALVAEARQKVEEADSKFKDASDELQQAEKDSQQLVRDIDEAATGLELAKERRAAAEEALKDRRSGLKKASSAEASARARLEQAKRRRDTYAERHAGLLRAAETTANAVAAAGVSLSEISGVAADMEAPFRKLLAEVEAQFGIVGAGGKAVGMGVVDCKADARRKGLACLEKAKACMDAVAQRQAELDAAEEELHKADEGLAEAEVAMERLGEAAEEDHSSAGSAEAQAAIARRGAELQKKNREKELQRCDQARDKAAKKAEDALEAMAAALQALVEAGQGMAESFEKTKGRTVKVDQVKAATSAFKASLRPLVSSFSSIRKARENVAKAISQRRKRVQEALAAAVAEAEGRLRLNDAERELGLATAEDAQCREEREAAEHALGCATAESTASKVAEAEAKQRKDELNAAKPLAKERMKRAKEALKEASSARKDLHDKYSKAESEKSRVEEAKNSAVHALTTEKYDPTQVQQAYERAKGGGE